MIRTERVGGGVVVAVREIKRKGDIIGWGDQKRCSREGGHYQGIKRGGEGSAFSGMIRTGELERGELVIVLLW